MKLAELFTEVRVDNSKYRSSLGKAESMTRTSAGKMNATFKRLAVGIGAYLGARQLFSFLRSSIRLGMEQEKVNMAMAMAMKTLGVYTQGAYVDLKKFAAGIQRVTTLGDEEVQAIMNVGMMMGRVSGKQLKDFTTATLGLSTMMGINVTSAARYMAMAMSGEFTMFNRYMPVLRGMTSNTEKLAYVMKMGGDGFLIMKDQAKSSFGQMTQAVNIFKDNMEKLGAGILKGFGFNKLAQMSSKKLSQMGEDWGTFGRGIGYVGQAIVALTTTIVRGIRMAFGTVVTGVIIGGMILGKVLEHITFLMGKLPGAVGRKFRGANRNIKADLAAMGGFAISMMEQVGEAGDKIKDTWRLEPPKKSSLEKHKEFLERIRILEAQEEMKKMKKRGKAGGPGGTSIAASAFGAMPIVPVAVAAPAVAKTADTQNKQLNALEQIVVNTKEPKPIVLQ